jgi:hypothetical protein
MLGAYDVGKGIGQHDDNVGLNVALKFTVGLGDDVG